MAITLDGSNGILSPDFEPSSSTLPTNGLYLPSANTLGLATNGTGKAFLDSAGNFGLGVTPSAWFANSRVIQLNSGASIEGRSNDGSTVQVGGNYYLDSAATYRYLTTNYAQRYAQAAGYHYWFTAPSGTAGNAISWTQAMTLDASGRLTIPNQPSFFAKMGGAEQSIAGSSLTQVSSYMNSTDFNVSSSYNTTSGKFTAPISGVYHFDAALYIYPVAAVDVYIYVNGSSQYRAPNANIGTSTNPNSARISITIKINAGDYVEVYASCNTSGGLWNGGPRATYFCGYLIG